MLYTDKLHLKYVCISLYVSDN